MKLGIFICLLPLLFLNLFCSYDSRSQSVKYVTIITIDGLRPDIINKSNTPGLSKLLSNASYSLDTTTVWPSITLPSHLSLVSGLTPEKHGVKTNKWEEEIHKFKGNTLFTAASSNHMKSSIIVGKEKLKVLKNGSSETSFEVVDNNKEGNIKLIKNSALKHLNKNMPNLLLIHFPEPDLTGHEYNWLSEEYYKKLKEVDKYVYALVKVIEEINSDNDYLIIITADHGGIGNSHTIKIRQVMEIPLIILGNSVKKNNKLENQIIIYDIAPTVYDFLNLEIPGNLDGKIINNIYID